MKTCTIFLTIILFTNVSYAGGSCFQMKILKLFNETKKSFSLEVENPSGTADGVAISERKLVKGKRKSVSIINIQFGMKDSSKYQSYLESVKYCKKLFKQHIKSKKTICLGFMAGDFVQGYERVFQANGLNKFWDQREKADICYLYKNPYD